MSRTQSVHSMSGSVSSIRSRDSNYMESTPGTSPGSIHNREVSSGMDTWAPKKAQTHRIDLDRRGSMSTDNGSHSGSTLPPGDEVEEMDLKTPRAARGRLLLAGGREHALTPLNYDELLPSTFSPSTNGDEFTHRQDLGPAGPMTDLLQTLLSKVSNLERRQPTVMAQDYAALSARFRELEKEHKTRTQDYLDMVLLRNGDLENLIKVRDLLAKERRAHDEMKQLRDEDLQNVLILREKLADASWAASRTSVPGATTPSGHNHSSSGAKLSMKQSDYLWQVARTAAMEQRVLELEGANKELWTQLQSGALVPSSTPAAQMAMDGNFVTRVESLFEDSLKQREKMAIRMQALRSEKDSLLRDVATLEDRNAELEAIVERLQRNLRI